MPETAGIQKLSSTMKQIIEVTSQTEFDACVADLNIPLVTKGEFEAWGDATVEAWDNATVEAWGNATVHASAKATVHAWGDATVHAWDKATVEARDNVFIRLYGALRITATPTVIIAMHGTAQSIDGGRQIPIAPTPETGAECESEQSE